MTDEKYDELSHAIFEVCSMYLHTSERMKKWLDTDDEGLSDEQKEASIKKMIAEICNEADCFEEHWEKIQRANDEFSEDIHYVEMKQEQYANA
jgi:hypothetical protein